MNGWKIQGERGRGKPFWPVEETDINAKITAVSVAQIPIKKLKGEDAPKFICAEFFYEGLEVEAFYELIVQTQPPEDDPLTDPSDQGLDLGPT